MSITELGECSFSEANQGNIPVDLWLRPPGHEDTEEEDEDGDLRDKWVLVAANYLPRKACVGREGTFRAAADTREELVGLIQEHVVPLYETALKVLKQMVAGEADNLYYWQEEKKEDNG